MGGGLIYEVGMSVVPGGTSGGAKTMLRQMEALLASSDSRMPQHLSDLSKLKKTTHFRDCQ